MKFNFLCRLIIAVGICMIWGPAIVVASDEDATSLFHVAQSISEKTLNSIIRRSESDNKMIDYVLRIPRHNILQGGAYSDLFTENLLNAWANTQAKLVQQDCDGKYLEGEICGIDENPISCGQDFDDTEYLYQTQKQNGQEAIIFHHWAGQAEWISGPKYRLVKSGNDWKLDGVDCGDGLKFNMD